MKQIVKKYMVYQFYELSDETKEEVLNRYRDINVDSDWYECIFDAQTERLSKFGFSDVQIFFTGFYSQGDGACFDAEIDLSTFIKYKYTGKQQKNMLNVLEVCDLSAIIDKTPFSNHYSHENARKIRLDIGYYPADKHARIKDSIFKLQEDLESVRHDESQTIYASLWKSYEYLTSDDCIADAFDANECHFTENGKMYY